MNIERLLKAYLKMRDTLSEREREFKEYKKGINDQMEVVERAIKKHLLDTGVDNVSVKGIGTTFLTMKDSVTVKDGETFRKFLCERMLMTLQPHMYRDVEGNMRADGQTVLEEHIQTMLNSGAFDLMPSTAHKANTKQYMVDHDGLLPPGIDYTKEQIVQVRKK